MKSVFSPARWLLATDCKGIWKAHGMECERAYCCQLVVLATCRWRPLVNPSGSLSTAIQQLCYSIACYMFPPVLTWDRTRLMHALVQSCSGPESGMMAMVLTVTFHIPFNQLVCAGLAPVLQSRVYTCQHHTGASGCLPICYALCATVGSMLAAMVCHCHWVCMQSAAGRQ